MRLTTRTNIAMRTLMFCAVNRDEIVRRWQIAEACNASENHLAQVINLLSQNDFVRTIRGRGGGLTLSRPASEIAIGEVFRTFEAAVPFAECFDRSGNTCPLTGSCRLRGVLKNALEAFYRELDAITLEELVEDNGQLHHIMSVTGPAAKRCAPAGIH